MNIRQLSKLRRAITTAFVVGLVGFSCLRADEPSVEKKAGPRPFEVILYLVNPTNIPMSKMFEDFAERGVSALMVNSATWSPFLNKGFLDYAAAYHIQLFFQAPYVWEGKDSKKDPAKEGEEAFRKTVALVRSHPHNEQVVGWWFMDEPESNFRTDLGWDVPKFIKEVNEVNDAIRRLDPGAKVISNHSHTDVPPGEQGITLTKSSDRQWYDTNEDYATSSNAFCLPQSRRTLAQELLQAKRRKQPFYWQNCLGASPRDMRPVDYAYYGFPTWMTPARFDQEYPSDAEVIKDYMLVLYEGGANGAIFYCYEGTPAWLTLALVRPDGSDRGGRWGAVLQAMQEIRRREGAPALRLAKILTMNGKPGATFELTRGTSELRELQVEVSNDDGLTWQAAPDVKNVDPYVVTVVAEGAITAKTVYRARAQGSDGATSLWVIWRPMDGNSP